MCNGCINSIYEAFKTKLRKKCKKFIYVAVAGYYFDVLTYFSGIKLSVFIYIFLFFWLAPKETT